MKNKTVSRQVRRRLEREELKRQNLKLPTFDPMLGNRRVRRLANQEVNSIRNTRKKTKGRDIYYQYIYEIQDKQGNKIKSFGTKYPFTGIKSHIYGRLTKKEVSKYNIDELALVLIKTIKHTRPSQNYIKVQKIILSNLSKLQKFIKKGA